MERNVNSCRDFFEIFDKIFVINLEHRRDRRKQILKEFHKIGIDFEKYNAKFVKAVRPDDAGIFPSIGARGCFLSHLNVLKEAFSRGLNSILILEDDVSFTKYIWDYGVSISSDMNKNEWEIFYGGYGNLAVDSMESVGILKKIPVNIPISLSHCIGLRRRAIEHIVPYFEAMLDRPAGSPDGGPMHVDGAYSWFRRAHPELITLAPEQVIADQRPSRTDIHDIGLSDRIPLVSNIKQVMRNVMYNFKSR